MRIAAARGYFRRLTKWIVKPKQPKEVLPIVEPARPRTRTRAPPRPVYHQEPAAFMPKPEAARSLTTENPASSTSGRTDETTDTRRQSTLQAERCSPIQANPVPKARGNSSALSEPSDLENSEQNVRKEKKRKAAIKKGKEKATVVSSDEEQGDESSTRSRREVAAKQGKK